jgi:hypothetical protein
MATIKALILNILPISEQTKLSFESKKCVAYALVFIEEHGEMWTHLLLVIFAINSHALPIAHASKS